MPLPLVVLDASAALALLLVEEEGARVAEVLENTISRNGQIFVPGVFWYEVGNGLLAAERRKRLSGEQLTTVEELFSRLPVVTHALADATSLRAVHELARKHGLSFYDASYLELALRSQASLITCDAHLTALRGAYPRLLTP